MTNDANTSHERRLRLARALGLNTMDRIHVGRHDYGTGSESYYDWFFFEEIAPHGMLVCRSAAGGRETFEPGSVRDVRPGRPVRVMAMPCGAFLQRSKLTLRERQQPPPAEIYKPGVLTYVSRLRNRTLKGGRVVFDDPADRHPGEFTAPLSRADDQRLPEIARSGAVPVVVYLTRRMCAGSGETREENRVAGVVGAFFACGLAGDRQAAARLASDGAARVSAPVARKLAEALRAERP